MHRVYVSLSDVTFLFQSLFPCLRSIPFYSNYIIIQRFVPFCILLFYFFYFSIEFIFLFILELRKFSNAFSANALNLMPCLNKNLLR